MALEMNAPLVLIVEDEPKLAGVLQDYLLQSGFRTQHLQRGDEVIPEVRRSPPDLILLDLMLPGRDGMAVCRELRQFSNIPVIMTTARVEEIDRLLGLELGADDYVCKPYSPKEVVARVKAILRRLDVRLSDQSQQPDLQVDITRYQASLDGQQLDLTPVELRLLHALLQQPGRILSRDQLMDRLYTDNRLVTDRTVDTHVKNLRRKLDACLPNRELIRSVYGVGYRLDL